MSESHGISRYLRTAAFILAGLSVLLAAGIFGLRYSVRQGMSAADIAEMERFFTEPVTLPVAWRTIEPFPAELIESCDALENAYSTATAKAQSDDFDWSIRYLPSERILKGEALEDAEWEQLTSFVERYQLVGEAARKFSTAPDYDLNVTETGTQSMGVCMYVTAQYLWAEGCLHAREGRWREAFEDALLSLRLARRHEVSTLGVHSHALAIESGGARLAGYLAQLCDDPGTLRWALEEMNRLAPKLDINTRQDVKLISVIGDLRWYARQGAVVDLDSPAPRGYFFGQTIDLYRTSGRLAGASWKERAAARHWGQFRSSAEFMYKTALPHLGKGWAWREMETRAEFDMARLEIAKRIEELENPGEIPPPGDLLAKYFPDGLEDPFSPGNSYQWYEKGRHFYSVGPSRRRGRGNAPITIEGELGPDAVFLSRAAPERKLETAR
jgi:hypothetical protein